jgi:hypothetical protein
MSAEYSALTLRSVLPRCLYSDEDLEEDYRKWWHHAHQETMDLTVTTVVPKMFFMAACAAIAQVLSFCAFRISATCSDEGVATYPSWMLLSVLPFLAARMVGEWACIKRFLRTYVQMALRAGTVPFKVMGISSICSIWLSFYLVFSATNFIDFTTDSAFTAMTMASRSCPGQQISKIWDQTIEQSIFGKFGSILDISWVALGVWLISFVQTIYPLILYYGRGEKPGGPSVANEWYPYLSWAKELRGGHNDLNENKVEGRVPYSALSEAAGLATVQGLAVPLADTILADAFGNSEALYTLDTQIVSRLVLSFIGENCVQINIQTSIFAINAHLLKKKLTSGQMKALLSIFLGIATTLLKLIEVRAYFTCMKVRSITDDWACLGYGGHKRAIRIIKLACVIMILSLLYAAMKLTGAFLCKDSMMNITGCVVLPGSSGS